MKTNRPAYGIGCLMLMSIALTASTSLGQTQEPASASAAASVVSSVDVTRGPQEASVRVSGTGLAEVHSTRMHNPERLVLDFVASRLAVKKTVVPGVAAPVRAVRLGQYKPEVARVVIDLTNPALYQIAREDSSVVVRFVQATDQEAGASTVAVKTRSTDPRDNFHYTMQAPRRAAPGQAKPLGIRTPRFALPDQLTRPSAMLASFGGQNEPAQPAAPSEQSAAPTVPTTRPASAPAVQQTVQTTPATNGRYTGEPISVNLKDVDLKDFFRLIHEISGLNVVLDPAVKGSLTIVLDEVPWDQALDIVLQNNGLDKQLSGNVLRIATRDTLKKEAETQRDLEKAQAEAVSPVTVTRVLSYAKASALKDTLKKFLSQRGDILSDDRSNQLIIRDIPSTIPTIDNLIRQLDRKSQQVEIEARVVSATRSFAQDIGVQLGFTGTTTNGRNIFSGSQAGQSPVSVVTPFPPAVVVANITPPVMPLEVNLGAGTPTSGITFTHRSPNFALDYIITAAEAKGVGKLLSKPKIVTQNNEKAEVKQGTKIPIQTTINNTISVQFVDAVLKLTVTPQITAEGTVFMDVLVENTAIDAGIPRIQGVPALDTQSAETKVLVADGGTVVIGGVIITSQRVDITEVPLVGSLPIIGHLFRRNNQNISSQELLFFLTPRIIPG